MYHLFQSFSGKYYVYESITNGIFELSGEEYQGIQKRQISFRDLDDNADDTFYKEHVMLQTPFMEHFPIANSILILEITQNCNFRCDYCVFSGHYQHQRVHSSQKITPEVIAEILHLLRQNKISPQYVSFYGGEALLEFDLIKELVLKVKEIKPDIGFVVTTNGYCLTSPVVKYLMEHDFIINFSFDGVNQDLYRKTASRQDTSDILFSNLKAIWNTDRNWYQKHINFNITLTPPYHLKENADFFNNNMLFNGNQMSISFVSPHGTDWLEQFNLEEENQKLNQDYKEIMLNLIENPENKHFERMLFKRMLAILHKRSMIPDDRIPMHGCCIPGDGRLFVGATGNLHMCDRNCGASHFGTIFNIDEIPELSKREILHYHELAAHICNSCWAAKLCQSCFASASNGSGTYDNYFGKDCIRNQAYLRDMLTLYVSIREKDDAVMEYLVR